jgi:hypothetical protein
LAPADLGVAADVRRASVVSTAQDDRQRLEDRPTQMLEAIEVRTASTSGRPVSRSITKA